MNSNVRASSESKGQMGVASPSRSGVTSVWVGSRLSKQSPHPPAKVTRHSSLTETETANHRKTRQIQTGTGSEEYVVVSVRNSISEGATPGHRRHSTVIPPTSAVLSAGQSSVNSHATVSGTKHPHSPASSLANLPLQTSPALDSSLVGSANNYHLNVRNGLDNSAPTGGSLGLGASNNMINCSKNIPGNNPFDANGSSSAPLFNAADAFNVNSLLNCQNDLLKSTNFLYGAGSFLPSMASSMPILPQTGCGLGSLLLQQQSKLTPDKLTPDLDVGSASLHQLLTLTQPTPLQSLGQPLTVSQTSFPLLTPNQFVPKPFVGQPLPLSQAVSPLDLARVPFLPVPSLSPLDVLSSSLMTNQAPLDVLSSSLMTNQAILSPDLLFPTLSTLFPTPPLTHTTTAGIVPTQTSAPPTDHNLAHRKSPPPILHQNPSEAYRSKREALRARDAPGEVRSRSPQCPLLTDVTVDPEEEQMTSWTEWVPPSIHSRLSPTSPVNSAEEEIDASEVTVHPCYRRPPDPQTCMRCNKKVYTMEKQVGPVRRVLYHKACFTCSVCRTALTLNNYHLNDDDKEDLNVYCVSHKPLVKHSPLDSEALLLQQAVQTLPRQEMCA